MAGDSRVSTNLVDAFIIGNMDVSREEEENMVEYVEDCRVVDDRRGPRMVDAKVLLQSIDKVCSTAVRHECSDRYATGAGCERELVGASNVGV